MREKYKSDNITLYNELWDGVYTLIDRPRFTSIDIIKNEIYKDNIKGDIVECGVWRGGMSIYLAYQFLDKKIWVCDSFEGFQPLEIATYKYYGNERHTEKFDKEHPRAVRNSLSIGISLEEVKNNFKVFGLEDNNINYLKGWVKDTLNPNTCPIKEISVLRVDVDAYSATLEVLDFLYDKVSIGGYIIFDDSALIECRDAIRDFKTKRKISFDLTYPSGRVGNDLDENGGYFKKI